MKKIIVNIMLAVAGFATTGFASVVAVDGVALETPPAPEAIVSPFTYNGTTVGGPTFNRPLANGNAAPTSLSVIGTAVSYDMVQFSVATAGPYVFLSNSVSPANWDNYTVLYSGSFDPASPLTNVLIANDDNPTIGKSGFTYMLQTGVSYFFITTGFANTSAGSFANSITAVAVPEPGTWVMIGASFVGLAALQRLRRTAA